MMIQLTEYFNKYPIWINSSLIKAMTLNFKEDGTNIIFVDETAENSLCVVESPNQIITLINSLKYE